MQKKTTGVYIDKLKNGRKNFRSSFTYNGKHISLGSYSTEKKASAAYVYACRLMESDIAVNEYPKTCPLIHDKFVVLCNLRDNNMYISNPIYIEKRYFSYYYSSSEIYKFDMDDLFYFSSHKLMKRGTHLFVSDYGVQTSVNERFGIKPFSVKDRDYRFINGDSYDYRRENIEIINTFAGVTRETVRLKTIYKTTIHVKSNYVVGRYKTEAEAAIAYNKAADILKSRGINKKYPQNYIEGISHKEYAEIYSRIKVSDKLYLIE